MDWGLACNSYLSPDDGSVAHHSAADLLSPYRRIMGPEMPFGAELSRTSSRAALDLRMTVL